MEEHHFLGNRDAVTQLRQLSTAETEYDIIRTYADYTWGQTSHGMMMQGF